MALLLFINSRFFEQGKVTADLAFYASEPECWGENAGALEEGEVRLFSGACADLLSRD